jgi:hypothetical protein
MIFYGNPIDYDLEKDRIIKKVDEPTFMTDRRRETLRVTGDGTYYLHTNNDREEEMIITSFFVIKNWAADYGVKL